MLLLSILKLMHRQFPIILMLVLEFKAPQIFFVVQMASLHVILNAFYRHLRRLAEIICLASLFILDVFHVQKLVFNLAIVPVQFLNLYLLELQLFL